MCVDAQDEIEEGEQPIALAASLMHFHSFMKFPSKSNCKTTSGYSSATAPSVSETVDYYSETEFGQLVQDKPIKDVMSVMDELISVLSAIQPRLYNGVMRKLQEI